MTDFSTNNGPGFQQDGPSIDNVPISVWDETGTIDQGDQGVVGQRVMLRADIRSFNLNPSSHTVVWQLPEGPAPVQRSDLRNRPNRDVIARSWTIPVNAAGQAAIGIEIRTRAGRVRAKGRTPFSVTLPSALDDAIDAAAASTRARDAQPDVSAEVAPGGEAPPSSNVGAPPPDGGGRTGRSTFDRAFEAARMIEAGANAYTAVRRARGGERRFVAQASDGEPYSLSIDGSIALRRSAAPATDDVALWVLIKKGSDAISFNRYQTAMDRLLCGIDDDTPVDIESARQRASYLMRTRALPFNDTDAYRFLKVATEAFVLANVGAQLDDIDVGSADYALVEQRLGVQGDSVPEGYLDTAEFGDEDRDTLPYLALVLRNLGETRLKRSMFAAIERQLVRLLGLDAVRGSTSLQSVIEGVDGERCYGVLEEKVTAPIFLELIWSYWQEEGMLVQTMNAITRRFQNVRAPGDRDPLAAMEIDPLRPLNNVLWGYLQDEQHRLTVPRRAYEYDHHYGMSLVGKAVPTLRPADSRSKFIEAFHSLLGIVSAFYHQDDDTTVNSDSFPVLNAIREVHLILSQGAHNQFGDLPSTARQEMLIQQWLLARPEFREFLPTRAMVAYPEPWMHRVEAMKTLQGWTDASSMQFNYLATYGEQILLSLRYGAWTAVTDPLQAKNWARFWRPEIQGYIHAYRAVTGVDLSNEMVDTRSAQDRWLQPAIHLGRRLTEQRRGLGSGASAVARPVPAATVRRG